MFEKLGRFQIKRLLGQGAMGEVYLGLDPAIGREVAIKTIIPNAAQGEEAKARFEREARAAGVLNHPHLVTIYEFGEDQGVLFIAMEYVRGHDLEELFRDQSLSRSEALEVLAQVCDGLNFAHRNGIVHRDIKPVNVRVTRDGKRIHAKVMDFGVARVTNSDMTATGMVMGTVSYMAPEYIRTGKPDPRSDLFAVGVMLYECLSGRKPFSGDTTPTVLYKIVNEAPDPIETERLQGISPAIRTVLDRALCKNPDERHQTAEDLAKALRAAKDPSWMGQVEEATALLQAAAPTAPVRPEAAHTTLQPGLATPPAAPAKVPAPRPAGRTPLWLGLGALVLMGAGGTLWWLRRGPTPPPLEPGTSAVAPNSPAEAPATSTPAQVNPTPSPTPSGSRESGPVPATPEGAKPLPRSVPAPEPLAPAPKPIPKPAPDAKTIDQPERFQDEKLDNLPVHERLNLNNVSRSEAIQMVDSNPEKAIQGLRLALKADPYDVLAHSWLAVALHDQKRVPEFHTELREARRLGLLGQMAARNARFRSVFTQARLNRRLPADLAD